jgi:hypothetical protein
MSDNTNPQGSVDTSVSGAANAFMSILEPQTEEAQADPEVSEDEQAEELDTSAEETVDQEEVVEEPSKYRVKANGEELEVSLDELINGYSRTADYQKKTQSLAEQRKSVESERIKIDEAAKTRDLYAQRLQLIDDMLSKTNQVDLSSLKESDPIAYAIAVAERSESNEKQMAIRTERERVAQEQQSHRNQGLQSYIQAEAEKLKAAIPEFKDEAKAEVLKRDIRAYAKSAGYSDQELANTYDSRAVRLLYNSMRFEQLQNGKAGLNKKVVSAPKTIRPGTSNPSSAESEATKKDFERLRKSGNKADAARLFEKFI